MITREANFQTVFNQYLRKKKIAGVFELKQTRTRRLSIASVQQHQIDGLLAAKQAGIIWKLSDADPRIKPFDTISTGPIEAYLVFKYPGVFCIIPIAKFISWCAINKGKRGIELSTAKQLAEWVVSL